MASLQELKDLELRVITLNNIQSKINRNNYMINHINNLSYIWGLGSSVIEFSSTLPVNTDSYSGNLHCYITKEQSEQIFTEIKKILTTSLEAENKSLNQEFINS